MPSAVAGTRAHCDAAERKRTSGCSHTFVGIGRRRSSRSCRSAALLCPRSRPHTIGVAVARYYDPSTSQFLTRDPLDAATRDAYGYGGGDPVNNSDPTGLHWWNDAYDWAVTYLDPVSYALPSYFAEADAVRNGCGAGSILKYGAMGVVTLGLGALGPEEEAGVLGAEAADHIVLGKSLGLSERAAKVGGRHLMSDLNWRTTLARAIADGKTRISVVLDDVGAPERRRAASWPRFSARPPAVERRSITRWQSCTRAARLAEFSSGREVSPLTTHSREVSSFLARDRIFHIEVLRGGMNRLLLRSNRTSDHATRIEILFMNVQYLAVPTQFRGLEIHRVGTLSDQRDRVPTQLAQDDDMFVFDILSADGAGVVVAGALAVSETPALPTDPSEFFKMD